MARNIRIGDRVRAFLNASIDGEVIELLTENNKSWTVNGTSASTKTVCRIRILSTGKIVDVLKSELFIVDY